LLTVGSVGLLIGFEFQEEEVMRLFQNPTNPKQEENCLKGFVNVSQLSSKFLSNSFTITTKPKWPASTNVNVV